MRGVRVMVARCAARKRQRGRGILRLALGESNPAIIEFDLAVD